MGITPRELLRTGEAAGPIGAATIGISLATYLAIYAGLLVAYVYTLFHLARRPRAPEPEELGNNDPLRPMPAAAMQAAE